MSRATGLFGSYQFDSLKHAKMLAETSQRDVKGLREGAHGRTARAREPFEDRPPRGISECRKRAVEIGLLLNHMVQYRLSRRIMQARPRSVAEMVSAPTTRPPLTLLSRVRAAPMVAGSRCLARTQTPTVFRTTATHPRKRGSRDEDRTLRCGSSSSGFTTSGSMPKARWDLVSSFLLNRGRSGRWRVLFV